MFGKIFHGISEFFSDALPGFSVGCFLDGLLKGAVISAAVLGVIAALPEVAAVLVTEILIVAGVAGLVYLSQAWPSMSGNQRSEALGEILGGAIVGKFFPTSMLPPELPFPKLALMQTPEGITVPIIVSGTLAPSTAATLGGASSGVLMAAAGSTTGPGKGPG